MSTKFQIKRSSVSGKTPNTTNISPGELALNLTDQKLYSSNGTAVFEIGASTLATSQYLEVANAAFVVGNNTTQYLEVANAVGLIQENTNQFLTVANAAPLIANLTTKYLEVANATGGSTTEYLQVANAEPLIANLTTKYLEVANLEYSFKTSFHFNANAGQTEFAGTDQNGQVLDYYGNTAEVYLNGIKQIRGSDWYANTDSILTISEPAGTGDVVEIVSVNTITQFVTAPDLTAYLVQSDLNPYLEVANLTSQTEQYMQVANLATVATTGNYGHLTGTPSLAQVATTGSYNDLAGQPTIPSTTPFLQVANAVPLIQQNTSKYLEVANAVATDTSAYLEVANLAPATSKYLEVANVVATDTTAYLEVANLAPATSKYLEVANVVATDTSAYLEVANLAPATSKYLEVANVVTVDTSPYLEVANLAPATSKYLEVANVATNTSTSSAAISGNTATFNRADGSSFTLDVSTLYDRYITGSSTSGNNLTMTLNDGSSVTVDLGPLVAGAANNLFVQSGAVSGNTLTLTLNDASTVAIDVSSLSDSFEVVQDTTPQLGGDLDTNGNDIAFADNNKAKFGADSDLEIYHDGTHSYLHDGGTGNIKIRSNTIRFSNADESKVAATINPAQGVTLNYQNNQRLATTSNGVYVTGDTAITGNTTITGDTTITGNTNVERLETSSAANSGIYFGNSYFITAEQTEAVTTSTSSTTIAYGRYDEAAIEFMVLVTDTDTRERQYSKILFMHEFAAYANGGYHWDARGAFMNEYAKMYTGNAALATFEVRYDYDGAMDYNEHTNASQTPDEYNIQLQAKPTSTNRMKFKVTRTGMRDSL